MSRQITQIAPQRARTPGGAEMHAGAGTCEACEGSER